MNYGGNISHRKVKPLENPCMNDAPVVERHLTRCPDCAHQVSTRATSCPKCGRPISAQVIEATSKKWKAGQVYGWIMMLFGLIVMCFASLGNQFMSMGLWVIVFGVIIVFVSRISAWWENG